METILIPAGPFLYGDEKKACVIDHAYRISKYPVTNAEYKAFVDAAKHAPPRHWQPDGEVPDGLENHPVVYVTWHDAVAYCKWAGGRLPTEEEWERAARGTDGREYPWGEWEEGRCNTCEVGIDDTSPVGRFSPGGDSPDGCADMAGNVWEWTASEHEWGGRVLRGGSWSNSREFARCAARDWGYPVLSDLVIGFRCVSPVSGSDSCDSGCCEASGDEIERLQRRVTELEIALEAHAPNDPALSQIPEDPAGDLGWVRILGDTLRETVRELREALEEIKAEARSSLGCDALGDGARPAQQMERKLNRIAALAAAALGSDEQ